MDPERKNRPEILRSPEILWNSPELEQNSFGNRMKIKLMNG